MFGKVAALRRRIAFKNPLLTFDKVLFVTHQPAASHMCDQYFGNKAKAGGSLYLLSQPFSGNPQVTDLMANAVVGNGRLQGQRLRGGAFLSPELSFDGKTILFAYTECGRGKSKGDGWQPECCYHIFRMNADGTGLVQLTDGPWNDFDPCWLPDGRIAFISERIGGFGRCHPRPVPTYTLHGMRADGSDLRALSYHETNEWHPSVASNGMLLFTRWDYVDRDSDVAHHVWTCYPDGRDPRSFHGNYPDKRELRPWMEMSARSIPGSQRLIAVAAAHHGPALGSLVLIDPRIADDRVMSQVRRITPEIPFPESEVRPAVPRTQSKLFLSDPDLGENERRETIPVRVYATPWPLSEDFYLCSYDPTGKNQAICLADSFGNKEIIYRDPATPCLDPVPLVARPVPPVLPDTTSRAATNAAMGAVAVMNVYETDNGWPANLAAKSIRVVSLFAKATPMVDKPKIGCGAQSLARGVLGVAPIEADGSAHFLVPAGVPVLFQLLDERGAAVQTMRSDTFVHPGERLTCIGCHENKHTAPTIRTAAPLALKRQPSVLQPEPGGSYPLSFARLVQPVLNAKCVACHDKNPGKAPSLRGDRFGKNGWSEAYASLVKVTWYRNGGNGAANSQRQYSLPGQDGARASKLYTMLMANHHDVKLTPEELRRFFVWMDCNSNFYGAYSDLEQQARGDIVLPRWGLPPGFNPKTFVR